jgi:hypothetical protein
VLAGSTAGQESVQFHGWVQWISGTQLVMLTDDQLSLAVDLQNVDQSSYETLAPGQGVTVAGVVAPDRSRVIARQVWPDPSPGFTNPRF